MDTIHGLPHYVAEYMVGVSNAQRTVTRNGIEDAGVIFNQRGGGKDNGWGSTIDEIGNLMEDKWFNIREFFSNVK